MQRMGRHGVRMLFRKKIKRCCAYCAHASKISDDEMVCQKKGIVSSYDQCRRFRYDPLKRIPSRPKPQVFDQFQEQDFVL